MVHGAVVPLLFCSRTGRPANRSSVSRCSVFPSSSGMSSRLTEPSKTSLQDVLILVHGTHASRESGDGNSWWQNGGSLGTELSNRLPDSVQLPECHEVFRWSGDNSERARIKAGRELLVHLESLEEKGQGYHVVGHSHGGSAISQSLNATGGERWRSSAISTGSLAGPSDLSIPSVSTTQRRYPLARYAQFARIVNAGAGSFCFVSANANRIFR